MANSPHPSTTRGRVVGDYLVGRQIGSGSFSVVWYGRHQVNGTEVAVKEIATSSLSKKLKDSLMSEISILKQINHPNIIFLHEIIEEPDRLYIVLEYCKDGDLSMYLQRFGKVPETMARNFMLQLAAGLKVLRDNNVIHRDLKPQNLLLSSNDGVAMLKIADFGFARPLQPRGMAETLCGSPLYMAPEIMQCQKYDAKADLWSVGAILFQFVTGKTPFTGSSQYQLLQNILKSNELHFPADATNLSSDCKDLCQKLLRRNPVERLTFEEFFNHPFVSQKGLDNPSRGKLSSRLPFKLPFPESNSSFEVEENALEDCLPFLLDDDSCGPDSCSSKKDSRLISPYDSSLPLDPYSYNTPSKSRNKMGFKSQESKQLWSERYKSSDDDRRTILPSVGLRTHNSQLRVVDSFEMVDQDYVLVSSPPLDASSSSGLSKLLHNSQKLPETISNQKFRLSAPVQISRATQTNDFGYDKVKTCGVSRGSLDMVDCKERIKSLQECAYALAELVAEKVLADKHLEAFSMQLVILAIWKRALHMCHAKAASSQQGGSHIDDCDSFESKSVSVLIEREFLRQVEKAEEFAKAIESGASPMPDAMEIIFQSALSMGRNGGVDELIGNAENARTQYSKAARLLSFLLVEAPSLILNPPFSLTTSDRYRLGMYIDILTNRKLHSRPPIDGQELTPP